MPATAADSHGTPMKVAKKSVSSKMTFWQVFHVVHRFAILVLALLYCLVSLYIQVDVVLMLRGTTFPETEAQLHTASLMEQYVGHTTLRLSPLVVQGLQNKTSPINGTIYLDRVNGTFFKPCQDLSPLMANAVTDKYLRTVYKALVRDLPYNLSFFDKSTSELIAPVVDCTSTLLHTSDLSRAKLYFLARDKKNKDHVSMVTLALSNQEFVIPKVESCAAVGMVTMVANLEATEPVHHNVIVSIGYPVYQLDFRVYTLINDNADNGYWQLQGIPKANELPKTMVTTRRNGFYMTNAKIQSNVHLMRPMLEQNPLDVITKWRSWKTPLLRDKWAWVHLLHVPFTVDALLNLCVLVLVAFHNARKGKLWVGDAFTAFANTTVIRGALTVFSWYVSAYALYELVIHDANALVVVGTSNIERVEPVACYSLVAQLDLATIYLSVCVVLSYLLRERIDPLVPFVSFMVGFHYRLPMLTSWFPQLHKHLTEFAVATHLLGVAARAKGQDKVSPLSYFTSYKIEQLPPQTTFSVMAPIWAMLASVVLYIMMRKTYFKVYPKSLQIQANTTSTTTTTTTTSSSADGSSTKEKQQADLVAGLRRQYTQFELATGAKFESRFGVLAEYENHLVIKGIKFAAADGIYSNGFVIANGKFVIQTCDFWTIVVIKLLRKRVRNVYAFEIVENGTTVKPTARLVYPHTLTWSDLFHVNITVLS